jgi:hypothetical protein
MSLFSRAQLRPVFHRISETCANRSASDLVLAAADSHPLTEW